MQYVLVFSLCALAIGWLRPRKGFSAAALIVSLLSIFWLQPLSPIRNLDFWFPLASAGLTCFVWAVTCPGDKRSAGQIVPGLILISSVVIGLAITRYLGPACCLTPSRPPQIGAVLIGVGFTILLASALYFFLPAKPIFPSITILLLVSLFVVLKSEAIAVHLSGWLRGLTGQSKALASSNDLAWLGISFLTFRLLHTVRDRQAGRLPPYSLTEFAAYALFFPAVISGPIDRVQHFTSEMQKAQASMSSPDWPVVRKENTVSGAKRILVGSFKKIVLADSLAFFALNAQNAEQTTSSLWMWVLLIAFALRIYLDFSGYTDIALGTALLMGISLPDNFDRPYTRQNITAFWNSWHITLAQWFRSYVFNPFTRFARTQYKFLPAWFIILSGQLLTMSLIGLWHGITWNFFIWGLWHALGLFFQNRWSEWSRTHLPGDSISPPLQMILKTSNWALTFMFVCLGWVWFITPTPEVALHVFSKLFGIFG